MANSRTNLPFGLDALYPDSTTNASTPSTHGINDLADPNTHTSLGDTGGPLGHQDHADPTLSFLFQDSLQCLNVEPPPHAITPTPHLFFTFDRTIFFANFLLAFGPLASDPHTALSNLLANLESDPEITDIRWVAYMLATVKRECANTYLPIEEYGKGKSHPYGTPDLITGQTYYGRGFVQLTHKENYAKMSTIVGKDLVNNPSLALDPDIAYTIMSYGMRHGSFTGKKLAKYFTPTTTDYKHARRIINGLDHAEEIALAAKNFEICLHAAAQ